MTGKLASVAMAEGIFADVGTVLVRRIDCLSAVARSLRFDSSFVAFARSTCRITLGIMIEAKVAIIARTPIISIRVKALLLKPNVLMFGHRRSRCCDPV